MDSNQDPRIQIYTNLDNVQNEIEKSAKDRKDEIRSQLKDDKKSLKEEMKDLKDEVKDNFKDMKRDLKDSDDPNAKEKINIANETRKIVEKNIEADYKDTIDDMEKNADYRLNSIDNMMQNSPEEIEREREIWEDYVL